MSEEDRGLFWMGSTKEDLSAAPDSVKLALGFALRAAQQGETAEGVHPMKGPLRDVMECAEIDSSGTYRLMYAAQIGDLIYVLDFFQKKSKHKRSTPQVDLDRIEARLKQARSLERERTRQ